MASETLVPFRHQAQLMELPFKRPDINQHFLIGGYACVHGDTLIDTPTGKILIRDFQGGAVLSFDGEKAVRAFAFKPVRFEPERLYRFRFSSGDSIIVTAKHRFLTDKGFRRAHEFFGEERYPLVSPNLERSIWDTCQSTPSSSVQSSTERVLSWKDRYSVYSGLCGAQPHLAEGIFGDAPPSQGDVLEHIQESSQKGDLEPSPEYSPCHKLFLLSTDHFSHLSGRPEEVGGDCDLQTTSERLSETYQSMEQSPDYKAPVESVLRSCQESPDLSSLAYSFLRVESITYIGEYEYYDMHVPYYNNYIAEGVVNHNCAKTTALKLLTLKTIERYWKYPVVGALMAPTITFLEKTLLGDLLATLKSTGSQYSYKEGKNILRIGSMEIRLLASGQPTDIYGHNLSFCFSDEHDELEQTKAIEANKAMQERVRIGLPDGRDPFTVIATTAQGLRGTYRIVDALKEEHMKYALVRGRTEDNTSLKPDYIRKLKALYTEEEQEAFLNGKFVNLTAGRVYYAYDESKHFVPVESVQPHETVYVGQDLNEGYSKASAVVVRNGRIEQVKDFSFKAIGHAPRILRETFPKSRIVWYPDNSGKPILGGYIEEIEHYGIETVYTGRNPSILDRIFIVNKLFGMGRMVIGNQCKDTSMALKTRQFDDKGVPEKGKGSTAPDHLCFRGDTMVETEHGLRRIDMIAPGDKVWTRKGLRKVLGSGITGMARPERFIVAGSELWATPDHPVMTENRGWVPVYALIQSDIVYRLDSWKEKPSSSMELSSTDTREPRMVDISSQVKIELARVFGDSIESSGSITTAQSLMDTTSTTRTGTPLTTIPRILNAFLRTITGAITLGKEWMRTQGFSGMLSKKPDSRPLHGIEAQKEGLGTVETPEKIRPPMRKGRLLANIAGLFSWVKSNSVNTAPKTASLPREGNRGLTTKTGNACIAARSSESTDTRERCVAGSLAPRNNGGSKERLIPVYNLNVEGEHEYFANGILVSNCDSLDYVTFRIVSDNEEFMDLYELSPAAHKER